MRLLLLIDSCWLWLIESTITYSLDRIAKYLILFALSLKVHIGRNGRDPRLRGVKFVENASVVLPTRSTLVDYSLWRTSIDKAEAWVKSKVDNVNICKTLHVK
jgi:hypothetical protein